MTVAIDTAVAKQLTALDSIPTDDLIAHYAELFGKGPRTRNPTWLRRQLAWKIQEKGYGGLSRKAQRRLKELIAEIEGPAGPFSQTVTSPIAARRRADDIPIGTKLVRDWHGQQIVVEVTERGYEHDGAVYRSLSAAAKAITGSHWNGRLFFGLTKRGKAS